MSGKTLLPRSTGRDAPELDRAAGTALLPPRPTPLYAPGRKAPRRPRATRAAAIQPLAGTAEGIAYDVLRAEMLAQRPPLTPQDFAPHAAAAIAALGTIKPDHADWLTQFMVSAQADGIEAAALKLERRRPQLNRTEKRGIGLRTETPFSRLAFDLLTEKGRAAPLQALRATAHLAASRQAASAAEQRQREIGVTHYLWVVEDDGRACPACALNNGRIFAWNEPPPGGHPGMRSCCVGQHCRCVAQPVFADPEAPQDEDRVAPDGDVAAGPRRLGTSGVVALALLALACLSLLPLLPRWL